MEGGNRSAPLRCVCMCSFGVLQKSTRFFSRRVCSVHNSEWFPHPVMTAHVPAPSAARVRRQFGHTHNTVVILCAFRVSFMASLSAPTPEGCFVIRISPPPELVDYCFQTHDSHGCYAMSGAWILAFGLFAVWWCGPSGGCKPKGCLNLQMWESMYELQPPPFQFLHPFEPCV